MDLETLRQRLEYEQGVEKDGEPIMIMDSYGNRWDILSVNWDDEAGHWVIVGDY